MALAHDSNSDTVGSMYLVANETVSKLRWERSKGACLNPEVNFTPQTLAGQWQEIGDFTYKTYTSSAMDFGNLLPQMLALPGNPSLPAPSFRGRVAIVTGGARLGASVVVNDLVDPTAVVEEIRGDGGEAIGVKASVEDGESILNQTLDRYGHVDLLINNAGFVRDKSFAKMEEPVWDSIVAVHLNGCYQMTKAVWPHFVRQGRGSIVNTTSTSGIYGNFGQSNYSTAKLGILGLSEATAREGRKHNIRVNTIAPVASTGGLASALSATNDKNKAPVFKPEYVVPLVILLHSDTINGKQNDITGGLFEVGCGWHAASRLRPSSTLNLRPSSPSSSVSPEAFSWPWVAPGTRRSPGTQTSAEVLKKIERLKTVDVDRVEYKFTERDVILYNLGVGAKRSELPWVYEESNTFQPLPTFGVIPFFSDATIYHHGDILPNFNANQSLLGEYYLETFQKRLPISGHLSSTRRLVDVVDKGNAAVAISGYTTIDVGTGQNLFYNEVAFFMRGAGDFGGPRRLETDAPSTVTYTMPTRPPDTVEDFRTSEEQAVLYRLSGDKMAMHVDPEFSGTAGFPLPILQGMCTMGIAGKALFQRCGPFRSIRVRFAGPVVPGQTLRTEMWMDEKEKGLVRFQTKIVETGKLCLGGGGVRLWDVPTVPRTSRI